MKFSIVLPYYNRLELLENVLRSIEYFSKGFSVEIIVVDDGSDKEHQPIDVKAKIIRISRDSKWRGPSRAYNTGFDAATGDIIILNSAECVHIGNIFRYLENNFKKDSYISFATLHGTPEMTDFLNKFNWKTSRVTKRLLSICREYKTWWHSHSKLNLTLIPYCAAVSKKNLDILGGYDERFSAGIGYDDYEFVDRIKNLGLKTSLIDFPFVVHQWHPIIECDNKNLSLWQGLNKEDPKRIKAFRYENVCPDRN